MDEMNKWESGITKQNFRAMPKQESKRDYTLCLSHTQVRHIGLGGLGVVLGLQMNYRTTGGTTLNYQALWRTWSCSTHEMSSLVME